jgi:hypothetical protein
MKRISRITHAGAEKGTRVWLDQWGHWTRDEALAHSFPDDEANKRIKRIPHATVEDVAPNEEKNDV